MADEAAAALMRQLIDHNKAWGAPSGSRAEAHPAILLRHASAQVSEHLPLQAAHEAPSPSMASASVHAPHTASADALTLAQAELGTGRESGGAVPSQSMRHKHQTMQVWRKDSNGHSYAKSKSIVTMHSVLHVTHCCCCCRPTFSGTQPAAVVGTAQGVWCLKIQSHSSGFGVCAYGSQPPPLMSLPVMASPSTLRHLRLTHTPPAEAPGRPQPWLQQRRPHLGAATASPQQLWPHRS